MRRDWDVVRKILLKAEELPTESSMLGSDQMNGTSDEVAAYHMRLMLEAGLIEGGGRPQSMVNAPPFMYVHRLTWEGHDLLDRIRRDTVWNRIKTMARDKGIDLTVETIKALARIVLEELLR